jgi:hypothetical protein
MNTWQAILSHAGLGAIQAIAGAQYLDTSKPAGLLGNTAIQIGLQLGATFLQGLLAFKNSNTDPKGAALVPTVDGKGFVTSSK